LIGSAITNWNLGKNEEGFNHFYKAESLYLNIPQNHNSRNNFQLIMSLSCLSYIFFYKNNYEGAAYITEQGSVMIRNELELNSKEGECFSSDNMETASLQKLSLFLASNILMEVSILLQMKNNSSNPVNGSSPHSAPSTADSHDQNNEAANSLKGNDEHSKKLTSSVEGNNLSANLSLLNSSLQLNSVNIEYKCFRKLGIESKKSDIESFIQTYMFLFRAVFRVFNNASLIKTRFLFEKSLESSKKMNDKHGEGLTLFYQAAFFEHENVEEKKKRLVLSAKCFQEAGTLGYVKHVEAQLKLLSANSSFR